MDGEEGVERAGEEIAVGVDAVGDAYDVVVYVLQVEDGVAFEDRYFAADQDVEYVAFGGDDAADAEEIAFEAEDVLQGVFLELCEDAFFDFFDAIGEPVDDGEVVVGDGVEEGVEEGAYVVSKFFFVFLPAFDGFVDGVDRAVVDADEVVGADEEVHAFGGDAVFGFVVGDGIEDEEVVAFVGIDFWAFVVARGVFDGEGMEFEFFAQEGDVGVLRVLYVEPDEVVVVGDDFADVAGVDFADKVSVRFADDELVERGCWRGARAGCGCRWWGVDGHWVSS